MTQNAGQLVNITAVHHVPAGKRVSEIMEAKVPDPGEPENRLKTLVHPLTLTSGTRPRWKDTFFSEDPSLEVELRASARGLS